MMYRYFYFIFREENNSRMKKRDLEYVDNINEKLRFCK